jgi:hypothetical protein
LFKYLGETTFIVAKSDPCWEVTYIYIYIEREREREKWGGRNRLWRIRVASQIKGLGRQSPEVPVGNVGHVKGNYTRT